MIMSESSELEEIRVELRELHLLYKKLAEDLIPKEEPIEEELEALDAEQKEYLNKDEILAIINSPKKRRSTKRTPSA
jgi:hypothetical protein